MKRKILIVIVAVLTLFLALPIGAAYWVVYTEGGLRFAIGQLDRFKKIAQIQATGIHGTLVDGVRIEHVVVDHERVGIQVEELKFKISPRALFLQTVLVDQASIRKAHVELRPRTHPPSNTPLKFLPSFLRIVARESTLDQAEVVLQNHYQINAHALRTGLTLTSKLLTLNKLFADGGYFTAAGNVDLGAADPITLSSELDWTLVFGDRAPWQGKLHAKGNLNNLAVTAEQTLPVQAAVTGQALALTRDWHWEARVTSPFIDFTKLNPAAKIAAADIALDVRGNHTGMQVAGMLRPTTIPTGILHVSARGPYPTRHVQLDAINIEAPGGVRIEARAAFNFIDGGPDVAISGRSTDFRWPILDRAVLTAKSAGFSLSGPHLPYRFTVTGAIDVPRVPAFSLEASGLLDSDHLELNKASAGWLKGRIDASGRLGWSGRGEWDFALTGADLNPGVIDPAWPGRLHFGATVNGTGLNANADIDLKVARVAGILRGENAVAQGRVRRRGENLMFDHVQARLADAHAEVNGSFGNPRDIRLSIEAPHLHRVMPQVQGSVSIKGRIAGPAATARLSGSMTGHGLLFGSLAAQELHANADIDLSDKLASHFDLKAQRVTIAERNLGSVEALLDGRASEHHFTADANGGLIDIHGAVTGAYDPKGWRGSIDALRLHNADDVNVSLEAPAALRVSSEDAALAPLCLIGTQERVCARGDWARAGLWNMQANGAGIPLRAFGANLPTKPVYMGALAFDTEAHGKTLDDAIGHLSVELAEGNLRYKLPSGREDTVHLGSGHAELNATPSLIDAKLHLAATEQSFLDIKLQGARAIAQGILQTPVSGEIHAQGSELGFIALLVDQIDRAAGQMSADLALSGTLAAPRLDGAVKLQQGELDIYQVNLLMRAINARVDIAGTRIAMAGSTTIGAGKASIAGELAWTDRKPQGEFHLTGERLMMVNIPEVRADASPNLLFKIDGRRIDVGGTVTIPYARIKPADLTGAVLSSSDEIIVGEQNPTDDERLMIYTDVKLVLGTDVTVDTYGLTGRLTGSVAASSDPSGAARGSGELKIEEGRYAAYGRQLDIQHGRLIFSGGLVSDPAVDLRAVKVFPDVTAGVNVRGKLRSPQISFFSDPSLPQSQVVSVLVAGGTIESLQKGGTQQVGQARNELLAQGGAIVAQQLGARLGVEDVGLESDTFNQTSLVLGKFLNPRLYVSYGISLSESLNTVKLRYTLGDRWTIKTEAGEKRSTDLIYTIER